MNLSEIKSRADAFLAPIKDELEKKQDGFQKAFGRKWGALWTHLEPPEHTAKAFGDVLPDNVDGVRAEKELATWEDFMPGIATIPMPVRLCVIRYAPQGQEEGWVLQAQYWFDGVLYQADFNFGPEERSMPWTVVEESS